jgi:hypothetical protein
LDQGLKARLCTGQPHIVRARWPDLDSGSVSVGHVAIAELRPTQATVGFTEVMAKRRRYRATFAAGGRALLQREQIPIVVGPEGHAYVLDRHHELCALLAEGVVAIPVAPRADLRRLSPRAFWSTLDARGWCHPYDADGQRLAHDQIPTAMSGLVDDPYRSLASALRRLGGFEKVKVPYGEFAWADFLRRRLDRSTLEVDFEGALQAALQLSGSEAARALPGWRAGRLSTLTSERPKTSPFVASILRRGAPPQQRARLLGSAPELGGALQEARRPSGGVAVTPSLLGASDKVLRGPGGIGPDVGQRRLDDPPHRLPRVVGDVRCNDHVWVAQQGVVSQK